MIDTKFHTGGIVSPRDSARLLMDSPEALFPNTSREVLDVPHLRTGTMKTWEVRIDTSRHTPPSLANIADDA